MGSFNDYVDYSALMSAWEGGSISKEVLSQAMRKAINDAQKEARANEAELENAALYAGNEEYGQF